MTGTLVVSVIIPTRDRRASLRRVLSALERQTLPRDQFEVVISVDGSTDGAVETAEEFASPFALQVLWQTHAGRAAACNAGARRSRGDIVLFLDDDMAPSASLLEAPVGAHRRRSRIAVLGAVPISLSTLSPPVVQYIGSKFDTHLQKLARPQQSIGYRDFYSGNCSIDRAVLFEVGLFDEAFQVYGNEDGELAKRLLAARV